MCAILLLGKQCRINNNIILNLNLSAIRWLDDVKELTGLRSNDIWRG